MSTHVMLDIETLGRAPAGMIISIGAVQFDENGVSSKEFYKKLNWNDSAKHGNIDVNTVIWWMKQSDEARLEVISGTDSLSSSLREFQKWFPKKSQVWGKGPTFDISIMENAFTQCNVACPWGYYYVRDVRTIIEVTKGFVDPNDYKCDADVAHDALSDAIWQARYVSAMLKFIKEKLSGDIPVTPFRIEKGVIKAKYGKLASKWLHKKYK